MVYVIKNGKFNHKHNVTKVINGVQLKAFNHNKFIYWSNGWECIWDLANRGLVKTVHGGPNTYGATDFYLTKEG